MISNYFFTSERLGFRNWSSADFDEFYTLTSDEEVMHHFPDVLSAEETKEFVRLLEAHYDEYGYTYYAVEILETKEFIGMIGLAYQKYESTFTPAIDIGWRLKRSAWGHGYATEGARRCLEYGFNTLNIDKVISVCTEKNSPSEHVMRKIGMNKIGEFDHPEMRDHPEYIRHHCYEVCRD